MIISPGFISPFNISAKIVRGFDPDAQAWIDRMTSPTSLEQTSINTFVTASKLSGNWGKFDEFWIRSLGSVNGLVGTSITGVASGGVTWSLDGAKYDGSTGFIDNNFDLDTDGVNYALNDAQTGIFVKTKFTSDSTTQMLFGVDAGVTFTQFFNNSPGTTNADNNRNRATNSGAISSNSLYASSWDGTDSFLRKDGVSIKTGELLNTASIPTGRTLYEGARNNEGTTDLFTDSEISVMYIASEDGFDHSANNTDIRQLLLDLGLTL